MPDWTSIVEAIAAATGRRPDPGSPRPVSGGCINSGWRLICEGGDLFVKTNRVDTLAMFEAEREGLDELRRAEALRVPAPYATGATSGEAWIAMEWIEPGRAAPRAGAELGEGLAAQHGYTAEQFGWHRDNTIGSTPQMNGWSDDWAGFFAGRRLGYQLGLAGEAGYTSRLIDAGRRLQQGITAFFAGYDPRPSLLHGDLWGGNWACDRDGRPFLFDPAVYYGDREADLAMTELFGGFDAEFRAAYRDRWPLDPGYDTRRHLYNLYHVLNHLNLFGSGYLGQAQAMTDRLLATVRG